MPATVQVVLVSDVDKVGRSGDVVRVRPGYARNFLVPRRLAVAASEGAVRRVEHEKAVALHRKEKLHKEATEVAARLSKVELRIVQRAGDDGRLFGSVTAKDIEAAAQKAGITVDRRKLVLKDPIRALGTFEVPVRFSADVTASVKVEVVAK